MKQINYKKLILPNIPYVFFVYLFDKVGQAVRLAPGADISAKILNITQGFSAAFENALPSVYPLDLLVGIVGAVIIRLIVYVKGKNAKKYRKGAEYGSARWGNAEDIKPYIDPDFQNNIILTQTERLTMNSRPKQPKYARNKNVVVIGGSGSGKTRFFVKPNLMQLHSSYVLTDPKEFPDLSVKPLLADVEQYEDFFAALEKASPVPIAFEQITNGANGYFSLTDKRIAIKEGVSELQAVKTAIHEIAHAKLHDVDLNAPPEQQNRVDRHTCEVEAESVAYTVCQHFGLDTSDYSFGYVAGWSSGKEMTELKASLETIQTTAKELITEIEGHFTELQQQRQAEQEQGDTFSIYQLKRGDETRDLRFEPYDRLQAAGLTIDRVNYELVYTAPLTKDMTLGDIWERFNIDHPADFKGHSLSVSDIVVLHQNDEDTAHYVDSIGFQQVPEFLQEQQTPVFDKLPPEQQQALSDTVQDTLQMLVDADKRIYGDVTGKTLEAIAAQGYSYKDGQLEKQQPEATPDSLLTGETVRTPRGNFHITDMSREQIEAAGFGFHHASEDGKYLIMGNGTQAYAIAAEQPQRDNPLKHVEDTIEQNDNNFDGLINNTPQTPTVADFEQRAKAGEAISVTDLAKAVKAEKREQPQKKPSILKKLDEYKKQAAQQPKDKQKEHKKDLEV